MSLFENEYCLLCHMEIPPLIGWGHLFAKEEKRYVCAVCRQELIDIQGERCRICDRPFATIGPQYRIGDLCYDCSGWEEDGNWSGYLEKNTSLFLYNGFLKEVIARFKFRGDYILAWAFAEFIEAKLKTAEYDLPVPIPLSHERLYERGFNQAEALIMEAGIEPSHFLTRTHTEKQSKKSRSERIHLLQVFQLEEKANVENKRILLIDDIYTTGSTLRHAAKVLKEAGAASVSSLTLARG